jgi:transposase
VVRVPSPEQEDARRLHRERGRLIAERVGHVERLDKLRTGDGRALPARFKAEIVREIKRLEVLLEMISTVEAERDAINPTALSRWFQARVGQSQGPTAPHRDRRHGAQALGRSVELKA